MFKLTRRDVLPLLAAPFVGWKATPNTQRRLFPAEMKPITYRAELHGSTRKRESVIEHRRSLPVFVKTERGIDIAAWDVRRYVTTRGNEIRIENWNCNSSSTVIAWCPINLPPEDLGHALWDLYRDDGTLLVSGA